MRINDISGEHALNLGHNGHFRGVDIDMFHFHTFDTSKSGQENYEILRSKVIAALNGDVAAKGEVTAWVSVSRDGLDPLLDLADVQHVYYASGTGWTGAGITLQDGWAETLLKTGKLATIDTELGAWSKANDSRFSCNVGHNSHVHVALDRSKLLK